MQTSHQLASNINWVKKKTQEYARVNDQMLSFRKHNLIDYIIWNQIMKIPTYKVHSILKAIMDDEGVNW